MRHHFDSIAHCKKVVQSTKVLLAASDEVVPHACSERLMAAWPGPVALQTMPGTDHFTIIEQQQTWLSLCEFARQHSEARRHMASATPVQPASDSAAAPALHAVPDAVAPPAERDDGGSPLPLAATR
ncbi:hypothetical protein D9M68_900900 [compost metagenome]